MNQAVGGLRSAVRGPRPRDARPPSGSARCDPWSDLTLHGVTHQSASFDVRERLGLARDEAGALLLELRARAPLTEWFVLSTCSRTEIYASGSRAPDRSALIAAALRSAKGDDLPEAGHLPVIRGTAAVRHLLRVASGIESIVLGDVQLLGQVRAAYEQARACGTTGPLVSRLCETALYAGKRARAETGIASGSASIASAGVELATSVLGSLHARRALVVGGGQMGKALAASLVSRGCSDVLVATRTPAATAELLRRGPVRVSALDDVDRALAEVDVAFSATSAGAIVVSASQVAAALPARSGRGLLLVDLAVPRNVDSAAGALPGVRVLDLETIEQVRRHHLSERAAEVAAVEAIVEEALARLMSWAPGTRSAAVNTQG